MTHSWFYGSKYGNAMAMATATAMAMGILRNAETRVSP